MRALESYRTNGTGSFNSLLDILVSDDVFQAAVNQQRMNTHKAPIDFQDPQLSELTPVDKKTWLVNSRNVDLTQMLDAMKLINIKQAA